MNSTMTARLIAAVILLPCAVFFAADHSPHAIMEINLKDHVKRVERFPALSRDMITEISFSPDESKIAVMMGLYPTEPESTRHVSDYASYLLVSPVSTSNKEVKQLAPALNFYPQETDESRILWSPKGDFLVVRGTILRIEDGRTCTINPEPGIGGPIDGFVDENHVIAFSLRLDYKVNGMRSAGPLTKLYTIAMDCSVVGSWGVDQSWVLVDTSPNRGLVALRSGAAGGKYNEVLVVEAATKTIIQRWPKNVMQGSLLRFAEDGKTLCAGVLVQREHSALGCWDVKTGELIAEHPKLDGGGPFWVASSGTRVVASDFRYVRGINEDFDGRRYKGRVLWDFRTGKDLFSWMPDRQTVIDPFHKQREGPYAIAISPSGKYIAEAGDGVVRIRAVD